MAAPLAVLGGIGAATGIAKSLYDWYNQHQDRNAPQVRSSTNDNPLNQYLFGDTRGVTQVPIRGQEQIAAINKILQHSLPQLGSSKFDFAPIEQSARQNFARETIPGIAERFTAMGSGPNSSGFNRSAASAAKDLELQLAGLKSGHALSERQMLNDLLRTGLTQQYESIYNPSTPGLVHEAIPEFLNYLMTKSPNLLSSLKGVGSSSQKDVSNLIDPSLITPSGTGNSSSAASSIPTSIMGKYNTNNINPGSPSYITDSILKRYQ